MLTQKQAIAAIKWDQTVPGTVEFFKWRSCWRIQVLNAATMKWKHEVEVWLDNKGNIQTEIML